MPTTLTYHPVVPAEAGTHTPVYPGGLGDESPNVTPAIPNQPIMHPRSI